MVQIEIPDINKTWWYLFDDEKFGPVKKMKNNYKTKIFPV